MSRYFVHGGTQYPYGQGPNSQNNTGSPAAPASTNNSSMSGGYYSNNYQQSTTTPMNTDSSFNQSANDSYSSGYNNSTPIQSYNTQTAVQSSFGGSNGTNKYANDSYGTAGAGYVTTSSTGFEDYSTAKSGSVGGMKAESGSNYSNQYPSSTSYSSSYDSALYKAASQHINSTTRGRGRGGTTTGTGRGRGGFRGRGSRGRGARGGLGSSTPANTGPKPIKATEIKAFLYAWCGQRKLKPEYEISAKGSQPKVSYVCKLTIVGMNHTVEVTASNKKDAQTKAAWEFCEHLVNTSYMKMSELPPKPVIPAPKEKSVKTEGKAATPAAAPPAAPSSLTPHPTDRDADQHGNWTLTNSRQRLNQFCQREHTTPEFQHQTVGPEHQRAFTCELKLEVQSLKKEFSAREQGQNKKQATALCALSMVRKLFAENLIEKCGDPTKHVTRGSMLYPGPAKPQPAAGDEKTVEIKAVAKPTSPATPGVKRKAEDEANEPVDDNGNWTMENSRQRLNQFCQVNNIPCDVLYAEEGAPGSRTYTASVNLKVKTPENVGKESEEKELVASSTGQSKKAAAQGCALQLIAQLFKLTLVEANLSSGKKKNVKKVPSLSDTMGGQAFLNAPYAYPMAHPHPFAMAYQLGGDMRGGWFMNDHVMHSGPPMPIRRTVIQDLYLNQKHKSIYPDEQELGALQKVVRTVELALKEVAEAMTEPEAAAADADGDAEMKEEDDGSKTDCDKTEKKKPKKRSQLQGVMRIGALAKGLLLKGDHNVELVLLCQQVPTAKMLVQVAQLLAKHIKEEGYKVETAMQNASIIVKYTVKSKVDGEEEKSYDLHMTIYMTSPIIRTPLGEDGAKETPAGALNKDKCLHALAELRHAKWFQACASSIPSCVIVTRVLREMTRRVKEWECLDDWTLELLAEKALRTSMVPLSLGGSFQRVLETIGSGIFLPGGAGTIDPCEREEVDTAAHMTVQTREDLTSAAQDALRLFVFRQAYKVLGVEPNANPWHSKSKA